MERVAPEVNSLSKSCRVEGCPRYVMRSRRLCPMHQSRLWKKGDLGPPTPLRRPRGSGTVHKNGYLYVQHGRDGKRIKKTLLHRLVMEEMLGRELLPEESVHHRNGDRADNRPENLELWSTGHPKGQRVEDKVQWAREILVQYGDLFSEVGR